MAQQVSEDIEGYPFQPAIHDGIPVAVPGRRREGAYGRLGKHAHPPLACPDPRRVATFRGFYRCPACGEKVPLADQVTVAEVAYELADRGMETLIRGAALAFWIAWDSVVYIARGVRWLAGRWGSEPGMARGEAHEMVKALVVLGMVAARRWSPEAVSEANDCQGCDD